jgi:hypothetical protein
VFFFEDLRTVRQKPHNILLKKGATRGSEEYTTEEGVAKEPTYIQH